MATTGTDDPLAVAIAEVRRVDAENEQLRKLLVRVDAFTEDIAGSYSLDVDSAECEYIQKAIRELGLAASTP